jgi:hypothetical protein
MFALSSSDAQAAPDELDAGAGPTQKDASPIQKDEPQLSVFTDYFEAHDEAYASGRHLIVYRHHNDDERTDAEKAFETTLEAADIQSLLASHFVLAKVAIGDAIQLRKTIKRTGYVRRRFRGRVRRTWTETVYSDLFDAATDTSGLLIVRVTAASYQNGAEALAHLPFGAALLSPHVFRRERELTPWRAETFRRIITTPIAGADTYVPALASSLGYESPHHLEPSTDGIVEYNSVAFDYEYCMERIASDRITTQIHLGGHAELLAHEGPLNARVDVFSLKNSAAPTHYVYRQLQPTEDWQSLEVDGLQAETPYRLRIYFYNDAPKPTLLGKASLPMDAATGGSTRLANARAKVVMCALGEVHDWDRGYTRGKSYVVGRWCERFYWWNFVEGFSTPYPYGYDVRTFSRHGALVSGQALRETARDGNIMGDHVRISGHGFMVLAYDEHLGQAWTIEGNYGNRAVLAQRTVQNYWSVGKLVESMLKAEETPTETVAVSDESAPATDAATTEPAERPELNEAS